VAIDRYLMSSRFLGRRISFAVLVVAVFTCSATSVAHAAVPFRTILVKVEDGQVTVEPVKGDSVDLGVEQRGLVIWSDGDQDRWEFFTGQWARPVAASSRRGEFDLAVTSRGQAAQGANSLAIVQSTTVLAQLRAPAVPRAPGGIVTPYDGATILNSRVTFRREAPGKDTDLPAVQAIIRQDDHEVLRIPFPQNVTKVAWRELENLPDRFKGGLPEGQYSLELPTPTGPERIQFTVCPTTRRKQVLEQSDKLATLLESSQNPPRRPGVGRVIAGARTAKSCGCVGRDRLTARLRTHGKAIHPKGKHS